MIGLPFVDLSSLRMDLAVEEKLFMCLLLRMLRVEAMRIGYILAYQKSSLDHSAAIGQERSYPTASKGCIR